jgi:glycosyltransferase involved in cell wall biosynthesis
MPELHPYWVGDHEHFTPEAVEESARLAKAANAKIDLDRALNPRAGEKVCIGTPHLNDAGWNYVESLWRMAAYDKANGDHLLHNSGLMNNGSFCPVWGRSMELSHARNTAAAAFLASDSDWLLWIDTDIGFESDALEKLLSVADPVTAPIVGGLCFIEGDYSHDFRGGLRSSLAPTLYDWAWIEPKSGMPGAYKMITRQDWPTDQPTRVGATGCGLLLTHRSVYEKQSAWLREQGAPPNIWFERIPGPDGERCGEDVSFCLRAHQVGLPILVHTGVITTHQKTAWYGAEDYRMKPFTPPPMSILPLPPHQWPKLTVNQNAAREAAQTSPIRDQQVPEATEQIAIIVPVAKRPQNAQGFMDSLAASVTTDQLMQVRVYVMADADDDETVDAWSRALSLEHDVIDRYYYLRSMGSFAEKVNRGYLVSGEPWLFLVGDDVLFHKGWLDQAMQTARSTGKSVVGTNDLGNPAVTAGEHATHLLIRRDYVENVGASWDGPGVVCHEGYRHWFVDNEIVQAAKWRGAWAPCLASHVEHLHPYYGKAVKDDVYRVGELAAGTDQALYSARYAKFQEES